MDWNCHLWFLYVVFCISDTTNHIKLILKMQEARSRFTVEIDPERAAVVEPLDGILSPDGTAVLHLKRSSPSPIMGRVNCKVRSPQENNFFCIRFVCYSCSIKIAMFDSKHSKSECLLQRPKFVTFENLVCKITITMAWI